MVMREHAIKDVKLEKDHWKEPDPIIGGNDYHAIREPLSEIKIQKMDGKWITLSFFKDSVITLTKNLIICESNDVANGKSDTLT